MENLKSIKNYYGDLTQFLIEKQNKARYDELENKFAKELEDFLHFWQQTFSELEQVSKEEVENIIKSNKELYQEANEILEHIIGFKPPPDRMFNDLMAIRSIALKIKSDEAVKFLNFDYLKKRNQEINQKWMKDRRQFILKRMKSFESLLAKQIEVMKQKLNKELWKLQKKRQKQYDKLMVKYMKCRNIISGVNASEMHSIKKLKTHFMTKNGVPKIDIPEEPDTDNLLSELDDDVNNVSLSDNLKKMTVKNTNVQLKSTEEIGKHQLEADNAYTNNMQARSKHNCYNKDGSIKVAVSSKKNAQKGNDKSSKQVLNTSNDSQKTITKKTGTVNKKKVKAK